MLGDLFRVFVPFKTKVLALLKVIGVALSWPVSFGGIFVRECYREIKGIK
jgi:hypothetical protein